MRILKLERAANYVKLEDESDSVKHVKYSRYQIKLRYSRDCAFGLEIENYFPPHSIKIKVKPEIRYINVNKLPIELLRIISSNDNVAISKVLESRRISLVIKISELKQNKGILWGANLALRRYMSADEMMENSALQQRLKKILTPNWSLATSARGEIVFECRLCGDRVSKAAVYIALHNQSINVLPTSLLHRHCEAMISQPAEFFSPHYSAGKKKIPYDYYLPISCNIFRQIACTQSDSLSLERLLETNKVILLENSDSWYIDYLQGALLIPDTRIAKQNEIVDLTSKIVSILIERDDNLNSEVGKFLFSFVSSEAIKQELSKSSAAIEQKPFSLWLFSKSRLYKLLTSYMEAGKTLYIDDPNKEQVHEFISQLILNGFGYELYRIFTVNYRIKRFKKYLGVVSELAILFHNRLCVLHEHEVNNFIENLNDFIDKNAYFFRLKFPYYHRKQQKFNFNFLAHSIYNDDGTLRTIDQLTSDFLKLTGELIYEITSLLQRGVYEMPLSTEN